MAASKNVPTKKSADEALIEIRKTITVELSDADLELRAAEAFEDLEQQQQAVLSHWLSYRNNTQALEFAGYKAKAIGSKAWQVFHQTKMMRARELALEIIYRKLKTEAVGILREMTALGKSNISDFADVVEKDVEIGLDKDGVAVTIKKQVIILKDFSGMSYEQKGAIKSLRQTKWGVDIQMHDKPVPLYKLAEHVGLFKGDTFSDALRKALAEIGNRGEEISLQVQMKMKLEKRVIPEIGEEKKIIEQ